MMLVEETFVPEEALPVDALKRHMRLGTGFDADADEDALLASFLRAAMAAIEARTGKALLQRSFLLTVNDWQAPDYQVLPIAPVVMIDEIALCRPPGMDTDLSAVTLIYQQEIVEVLDPLRCRLENDTHLPRLRSRTSALPCIPTGGMAAIRFTAGYADTFDALPHDLAQAVLMLATHFDVYRNEVAYGSGCMPFGVTSLIDRFRPMRIGFTS